MKNILLVIVAMVSLPICSARAADRGDIFIEVQGGPRFESTAEVSGGLAAGYCVWNSLSLGVSFDQYFAMTNRVSASAGFTPSFDVHWFFEPFEISGQVGAFLPSQAGLSKKASISGAVIYLFAITPAIALKAEVRARYLWNESTDLFWALGGRVLF